MNNKLIEITKKWEELRELVKNAKTLNEAEIADYNIVVNFYQGLAENYARDWDAQQQIRSKYENLSDSERVAEIDKELEKISINFITLDGSILRITRKLNYMEKIYEELNSLKTNLANISQISKCSCDNSLLEKKIDGLQEKLNNLTTPDFQQVINKIDSIDPTKKLIELINIREFAFKKENTKEETPPPISTKNEPVLDLLQDLKDQVTSSLSLNEIEQEQLKNAQNREQVEYVRNGVKDRIDKEIIAKNQAETAKRLEKEQIANELAEKDKLAKEQAEKERAEELQKTEEIIKLKEEVEKLSPNPTEQQLLAVATDKNQIEEVRNKIRERIEREKEKWVKEFQNFKTEIEKLGLKESEQKELDEAIDKWQAEKVKSEAETRIKQEAEQKKIAEQQEKERLAKEQAEKEAKEKVERERLIREAREKEQRDRDYLEKVRLAQEQRELNELKAEISKLELDESEKQLLSEASSKLQAEALRKVAGDRIYKKKCIDIHVETIQKFITGIWDNKDKFDERQRENLVYHFNSLLAGKTDLYEVEAKKILQKEISECFAFLRKKDV